MKEIKRLMASSILLISLSSFALADGGITQGPGVATPPPPAACEVCPDAPPTAPPLDSSIDSGTVVNLLFALFAEVAR